MLYYIVTTGCGITTVRLAFYAVAAAGVGIKCHSAHEVA